MSYCAMRQSCRFCGPMNQIALHGRKPRSGTGVRRSVDYNAQPKSAALGPTDPFRSSNIE
jgi:hypothetical protein